MNPSSIFDSILATLICNSTISSLLLIHGNPILGDTKYRMSKNSPGNKDNLMLHAYKINFSIGGTKYNFSAEPPQAFKNIVREKHLRTF